MGKIGLEIERTRANYLRSCEKHELQLINDGHYRMKTPDTGFMNTHVIFIGGRIVIFGDFSPTRQGVISDCGYGLEWFSGRLDDDYLAQKFLEGRWTRQRADLEARDWLDNHEEGESDKCTTFFKALIEESDLTQDRMNQLFQEIEIDDYELLPGYGYVINEIAALSAIQQKFAELYAAQHAQALESQTA